MTFSRNQEFAELFSNFLTHPLEWEWGTFAEKVIEVYPDMINNLDSAGNSILAHFVNNCHADCLEFRLYKTLLANGAKYIRDYKEEKSSLNLNLRFVDWEPQVELLPEQRKINLDRCQADTDDIDLGNQVKACINSITSQHTNLWSNWDKHVKTLNTNPDLDRQDMQQGRTPIHYAIISGKFFIAEKLIAAGASCTIRDKFQKSPLDYAVLSGNVNLVKAIIDKLDIGANLLLNSANKGVSLIVQACYSGNLEMYHLIEKISAKTPLDKIIIKLLVEQNLVILNGLKIADKLLGVSALTSIFPQYEADAIAYINQHILPELIGDYETDAKQLSKGRAYGIEVEISGMPSSTIVPIDLMAKALNVSNTFDASIKPELLMHLNRREHKDNIYSQALPANKSYLLQEFTSQILDSPAKIKSFLYFTKLLRDSGAIVNKSNGLHIHVNIRGNAKSGLPSIAASLNIKNRNIVDVELDIVKQILCNWSVLEPQLKTFLRYGELQQSEINTYSPARVLGAEIPRLLQAKTMEILISSFASKNRALNLQSLHLNSYGTVEVRMLEGTVEPELLTAWLNFIHKLITICLEQVEERIAKNISGEFEPYANIENLIDLLHIERNYEQTWDKEWKAPASVSILPVEARVPIEAMAPKLPLYAAFKKAKYQSPPTNAPAQVVNMLEINSKYPGVLDGYRMDHSPIGLNYVSGQCMNLQPDNYWSIQSPMGAKYGFDAQPIIAQNENNYALSAERLQCAPLLFLGFAAFNYLSKKLSARARLKF